MAQKQQLKLTHKGIYTNPNQLSEIPEGALSEATNCVIDKAGVLESRRGFEHHNHNFGSPGDSPPKAMTFYRGQQFISYTDAAGIGRLAHDAGVGAGFYTYSGAYTSPSSSIPVRFAEAGGSLFFTTDEGIKKIDRIGTPGSPRSAGAVEGMGVSLPTSSTNTPAWFEDDKTVSYRNVFYYFDQNGHKIVGEPSGRMVFTNVGGSAICPDVQPILPSGITSDYRMSLYRSAQVAVGTEPSDDMALVWDGPVDLSGSWTFPDRTPDDSRGPALYTNSTQEGIALANKRPPLAQDIATFRGCMFYANTTQPHQLILTLTGTGGTEGLQVGDRIQIGDTVYTAGLGVDLTQYQFSVETTFDSATNIQRTVESLVYVVNACGQTQVRAQLLGTADEFPGKMMFQEVGVGGPGFSVSVSARQTIWHPTLPLTKTINSTNLTRSGSTVTATTSTTHGFVVGEVVQLSVAGTTPNTSLPTGLKTVTATPTSTQFQWEEEGSATATSSKTYYVGATTEASDNEARQNRLYWSKPDQPEAVPYGYFVDVGSEALPILRIAALRDCLFIFKKDGVFRISGNDPSSFRLDMFDNTVSLFAPNTLRAVNNQLLFWGNQGICALSDTGCAVVSIPIEDQILQLMAQAGDNVAEKAFAIGSDSDRKYIVWAPATSIGTYCPKAFVWNIFREGWTTWDVAATCADINPENDRIYVGDPHSQCFAVERKDKTTNDYADRSYSRNITAQSGLAITLDSAEFLKVGDVISQDETSSKIESINGLVCTVASEETWQLGSCAVYTAIPVQMKYAVATANNPGVLKQWQTATVFLGENDFSKLDIGFETEFAYRQWVTINQLAEGTWGGFAWGSIPWGGQPKPRNLLTWVPLEQQRSSQLTVSIRHSGAWERLSLQGLSLGLKGGALKVRR